MSKVEKIYKFIENEYGSRRVWISDLSTKLGISKYKANILTIEAGYERGKRIKPVNIHNFKNNINVVTVIAEIQDNLVDAL